MRLPPEAGLWVGAACAGLAGGLAYKHWATKKYGGEANRLVAEAKRAAVAGDASTACVRYEECLELVRTACVEAAHRWRHQLRPLAEQRRDCGRHAAQALVPRFLQRRCLASHADTRPSISPHSPTIPGTASACREACMQAAMVAKTCWVALDALAH